MQISGRSYVLLAFLVAVAVVAGCTGQTNMGSSGNTGNGMSGSDGGVDQSFQATVTCTDDASTAFTVTQNGQDVVAEGTLELDGTYYNTREDVTVDEANQQVDITINADKQDASSGEECIAEADIRQDVTVSPGEWTVNLEVNKDGETMHTASETVTISQAAAVDGCSGLCVVKGTCSAGGGMRVDDGSCPGESVCCQGCGEDSGGESTLGGDQANYISRWPMDAGEGQRVEDIADGNDGNRGFGDGEEGVDPSWTSSRGEGYALQFDGSHFVTVPTAPNLQQDTVAVAAWVKPSTYANGRKDMTIVAQQWGYKIGIWTENRGGTTPGTLIAAVMGGDQCQTGGESVDWCDTPNDGWDDWTSSGFTVPKDKWTEIGVEYTGKEFVFYKNGEKKNTVVPGEIEGAGHVPIKHLGQDFTIGGKGVGLPSSSVTPYSLFHGAIDDVRVMEEMVIDDSGSDETDSMNDGTDDGMSDNTGDSTDSTQNEADQNFEEVYDDDTNPCPTGRNAYTCVSTRQECTSMGDTGVVGTCADREGFCCVDTTADDVIEDDLPGGSTDDGTGSADRSGDLCEFQCVSPDRCGMYGSMTTDGKCLDDSQVCCKGCVPADVSGSDTDTGDSTGTTCADDVSAAQDAAEGQSCTQQVKELACPDEDGYTYEAKNGCEISELENRGWTEAGETGTAGAENGAGTIRICAVVTGESGSILQEVNASAILNTPGRQTPEGWPEQPIGLGSPIFLPYTTDVDLLGGMENDARCAVHDDLPFGHYYYDEARVTGDDADAFTVKGHNDQRTEPFESVDDVFQYTDNLYTDAPDADRNVNADGHIHLSEERSERTLAVVYEASGLDGN